MNSLIVDVHSKLNYFDLDISFKMNEGILALQGDSGSGKTTTLNLITGIRKPNRGFVELDGKVLYSDQDNINVKIRDRGIAYVFQDYALFPHMTVKKNIFFGRDVKEEVVDKFLDIFHIKHLLNKYPRDISGGEGQRVALTRAIAINPKLLLLDEPFSALDEKLKVQLYKEFIEFKNESNIPIILITHNRLEAEQLADRILDIYKGKIIEDRQIDHK